MSAAGGMRLRAFVAPTEARALQEAARRLAEVLAAAGAPAPEVSLEFVPSPDALAADADRAIAICSLAPEVEAALEDWPAVRARLTQTYEPLSGRSDQPLFLCTVFRHVPPELEEAARTALRLGIRRLDLLAVELSHATGLNVIDIDRALAHVGALNLGTDFRLAGEAAIEAAGREIVRTILSAGLDEWIAPEVQERAAAALAAS